MNAKDALNRSADMSLMVLTKYVEDLSDADLMKRPGSGCNHLAWQLGHLISSNANLLNMVCPGTAPALPEGFADHHSKENCASDDPQEFCTKQQYVDLLHQMRLATQETLAGLPEAKLDAPAPEPLRNRFPTVGDVFMLIGAHPMMHAGQFVVVRRAAGKPVVI
jgi:hypothetical protein